MMEIRFRFLKLGLASRLVAAAALYTAAVGLQLILGSPFFGLPAILAAWLLLALKPATNKPDDQGLEEWRAVTDGEVSRMADALARSRKLRNGVIGPVAAGVMLLGLLLFGTIVLAAVGSRLWLVTLDLALFSLPGLFFGRIGVHVPAELDLAMGRFLAAMSVPLPEGYAMTPYLRFDKDGQGRDVPENLRLMLEPRRKPDDLVGVQFQAAINKGPNGNVPYMYAVALTRGRSGPAYAQLSGLRLRGYEVEPGGDDEYGTVVVRQDTSGGGYHTTDDDCESLVRLMVKALERTEALTL